MTPNMPPPYIIKEFESADWRETVTKISTPKVLLSPSTTRHSIVSIDITKHLGKTTPYTSPLPPYVVQRGATLKPNLKAPEVCQANYLAEMAAILMAVLWVCTICCITVRISRNFCSWCNIWVLFPCVVADNKDTEFELQEAGEDKSEAVGTQQESSTEDLYALGSSLQSSQDSFMTACTSHGSGSKVKARVATIEKELASGRKKSADPPIFTSSPMTFVRTSSVQPPTETSTPKSSSSGVSLKSLRLSNKKKSDGVFTSKVPPTVGKTSKAKPAPSTSSMQTRSQAKKEKDGSVSAVLNQSSLEFIKDITAKYHFSMTPKTTTTEAANKGKGKKTKGQKIKGQKKSPESSKKNV